MCFCCVFLFIVILFFFVYFCFCLFFFFFFSSRRRHTRCLSDWSSDVCSSDLGVSVHGNRSLQNNFLLDGVDNNSISTNVQELSTQVSRPSIDSIGEFKVVTSPFTAEYGRAPGGAIVVTTKSGTNQVRGTAYDYFRNDRFDSISYFAERANQEKAANDQNQFGANIGGPIVESRAFFFFDIEATRITQGVLRTGRVATG